MRIALAALLFAPLTAAAACFVHPDTGALHCSSAAECPQPSIWNPGTHACGVAQVATLCQAGTTSERALYDAVAVGTIRGITSYADTADTIARALVHRRKGMFKPGPTLDWDADDLAFYDRALAAALEQAWVREGPVNQASTVEPHSTAIDAVAARRAACGR